MADALTNMMRAATVAISNTTNAEVRCPLANANAIEVYIRSSSTEQVYTLTLENGETIECPNGASFELSTINALAEGEFLFTVQTATGAAVLQVVGFREPK